MVGGIHLESHHMGDRGRQVSVSFRPANTTYCDPVWCLWLWGVCVVVVVMHLRRHDTPQNMHVCFSKQKVAGLFKTVI